MFPVFPSLPQSHNLSLHCTSIRQDSPAVGPACSIPVPALLSDATKTPLNIPRQVHTPVDLFFVCQPRDHCWETCKGAIRAFAMDMVMLYVEKA
jgi:hypothetical protein